MFTVKPMSETLFCSCFNIDLGHALHKLNGGGNFPIMARPKALLGVNLWHVNRTPGKRSIVNQSATLVEPKSKSLTRKDRIAQLAEAYTLYAPHEISPFEFEGYCKQ